MAVNSKRLELTALEHFPAVEPGDDLAELLVNSFLRNGIELRDGDVLVLAQKIVSKAEDRYRTLKDVEPSDDARQLADEVDKDARLIQLILDESTEVVRKRKGVIIVRHRLGLVHANAGIDQSNIEHSNAEPRALLLPENPDATARALRAQLQISCGASVAIIINDSAGRAWRNGTCGIAIGAAGFATVADLVGEADMFGRQLLVSSVGVADELAAAASFIMGQAAEATPVVIIRGANIQQHPNSCAADLIRDKHLDLFG